MIKRTQNNINMKYFMFIISSILYLCFRPDVVFGKVNYLNPMDTRQYLYFLTPKPDLLREVKVLKGVTNIGKLDIVWKTNLGERGRLQTSQLQRVVCFLIICPDIQVFLWLCYIFFCHIYSVIVTLAFFSSEDTEDIE